MSTSSIIFRHISYTGQEKEPALLYFNKGLNVLYGASDTGKSFVLESIEFMLNKGILRDIPERIGYDRIFLGLEISSGETFTLTRSTAGGGFGIFAGLHTAYPNDIELLLFDEKNEDRRMRNISNFILDTIGLSEQKIKKNDKFETVNFTLNPLLNLLLVSEVSIQKQSSPILRDQYIFDTQDMGIFKLILTGVDDSSLISKKNTAIIKNYNEAKIHVLSEMIDKQKDKISENYQSVEEADEQILNIENSIRIEKSLLDTSESYYREQVKIRSQLRHQLQEHKDRANEILGMLSRFNLLDKHYSSDLLRLDGIRESGTLISVLSYQHCPLCGAAPEKQQHLESCDMNISKTIEAATAEYNKIEVLRLELRQTLSNLSREIKSVEGLIQNDIDSLQKIESEIHNITPNIKEGYARFSELIAKKSEVESIISAYSQIAEYTATIESIKKNTPTKTKQQHDNMILSQSTLDSFSQEIEAIFKEWKLAELDRVHFDLGSKDLVIAGKPRANRGKGLRAITYAAFIVGILKYCQKFNRPHFGSVILDSPLLAYRAPDGPEDSLTDTDVQEHFYRSLHEISDRQIIIIENTDPPSFVINAKYCTYFSGNPTFGRSGFFPKPAANV